MPLDDVADGRNPKWVQAPKQGAEEGCASNDGSVFVNMAAELRQDGE